MASGTKAVCPVCDGEIVPGTLYCWRHAGDAPRVGQFSCDEGQLVWSSSKDTKGRAEACIAVILEERQIPVHDVEVDDKTKPVKLSVHYSEVGSTVEAFAEIALPELVGRLVEGWESVNAVHRTS